MALLCWYNASLLVWLYFAGLVPDFWYGAAGMALRCWYRVSLLVWLYFADIAPVCWFGASGMPLLCQYNNNLLVRLNFAIITTVGCSFIIFVQHRFASMALLVWFHFGGIAPVC